MRIRVFSFLFLIFLILPACIYAQNQELESFAFNFNQQNISLFLNAAQESRAQEISRQIQSLFLTALITPADKFWVNLNAAGQGLMLDSALISTEAGRILAEADLRLKKDAASLTNPRASEAGRLFWQRLYVKIGQSGAGQAEIPLANKLWIVPQEAVVSESAGRIAIIEAKLKVSSQPSGYRGDDFQEIILPLLTERVNSAEEYRELRRLFCALIMAQCYKDKIGANFMETPALFSDIRPQDLKPRLNFSPEKIWLEYAASIKQGEYSFSEDGLTKRRHYFNGGIDFQELKKIIRWAPDKIRGLARNLNAITENFVLLPPLAVVNAPNSASRADMLAALMSEGELARRRNK